MEDRFDMLAKYVLEMVIQGTLSNALTYEFTAECSKYINQISNLKWTNNIERLWDYLKVSQFTSEQNWKHNMVFCCGRIYASVEMLKLLIDDQQEKCDIEKDIKENLRRWYCVLIALGNKNTSIKELATQCNLSEKDLKGILNEMTEKQYVYCLRLGKKKYYRLTRKGKTIVENVGGSINEVCE